VDILGVSIPENMEKPSLLSQIRKVARPDSKKNEMVWEYKDDPDYPGLTRRNLKSLG